MFSFHKPKVYRSTAGCCICKAKSSSSRFTDSKKYETDFIQCFQLDTPRRGEICNACVLLVKRFKRLPAGSNRHWGHVVDARTGPGLKSMTKFKKRKEEQEAGDKCTSMSERLGKLFKKKKKEKSYKKETRSLGGSSDDSPPSPTGSQASDDDDDALFGKKFFDYPTRSTQKKRKLEKQRRHRRKNPKPMKLRWPQQHLNFFVDVFDNNEHWNYRMTCCGPIYENVQLEALLVDVTSFKPCAEHQKMHSQVEMKSAAETVIQLQQQPTAIKKHQLFLKRHEQPSTNVCESVISSLVDSSNKHKTDSTESIVDGIEDSLKPFEKIKRLNESKTDGKSVTDENNYGKKDVASSDKFLHKLGAESIKISKPSTLFSTPLSASLKFKLANIVKCGTLGDNSSDSGYEEVQDGSKIPTLQSDIMQSL